VCVEHSTSPRLQTPRRGCLRDYARNDTESQYRRPTRGRGFAFWLQSNGTLARQIASFEDPMDFHESSSREPLTYLAELGGDRWDGTASTLPDLSEGAIVLYDVSAAESVAEFSVFISSGPRPDVPTDDGHDYSGPSQVYTCYGITTDLGAEMLTVDRAIFTECPTALVNELPEDAAFASGDVFDG
jgi:hypothetical protein